MNHQLMELAERHPYKTPYRIEHDGFHGVVIGHYITLEGKPGVVLQLDDHKIVHVYGEKWLVSMDQKAENSSPEKVDSFS